MGCQGGDRRRYPDFLTVEALCVDRLEAHGLVETSGGLVVVGCGNKSSVGTKPSHATRTPSRPNEPGISPSTLSRKALTKKRSPHRLTPTRHKADRRADKRRRSRSVLKR